MTRSLAFVTGLAQGLRMIDRGATGAAEGIVVLQTSPQALSFAAAMEAQQWRAWQRQLQEGRARQAQPALFLTYGDESKESKRQRQAWGGPFTGFWQAPDHDPDRGVQRGWVARGGCRTTGGQLGAAGRGLRQEWD